MQINLSAEERARLNAFVDYYRGVKGDEKGEGPIFLDRFFRAFGHEGAPEANATHEARVKRKGGRGFADLLWPGRVLIEMKARGENLRRHYDQLRDYWDHLEAKPRYAVLCNFDEFHIYDFEVQHVPIDEIRTAEIVERAAAFGFMFSEAKGVFFANNRVQVTREAAGYVANAFNALIGPNRGQQPVPRERAQRFILQCVVALFGEDAGLLPDGLLLSLLDEAHKEPARSGDLLGGLFRQMNTPTPAKEGRYAGVPYFNGGIFATVEPVEFTQGEVHWLREAAHQDWSKVQPQVFGSLFEASLDERKRHASGAHFTHEADIQKIVRPTIVLPWRERIEAAKTLKELADVRRALVQFRVLDPACGSGNFLYVAFREMKRLELELLARVREGFTPAAARNAGIDFASLVSTKQFFGIDNSPFAVELAKVTMMIAKELALQEAQKTVDTGQGALGLSFDHALPLDNLDANIRCADALFVEWPEVDAIIGNPPFQSKNKMQQELGADYVRRLRDRYPGVPGRADYCVYWIRRAHDELPEGGRAGLVGTNTIRQNYSREGGLDYVVQHGGTITEAVGSQVWSGDAAVHVSLVNWVKGETPGPKRLYTQRGTRRDSPFTMVEIDQISSSLSAETDVSGAARLRVNIESGVCYQGQTHGHAGFLLTSEEARNAVAKTPKAREVVFPYLTGDELLTNPGSLPDRYVIDFQNHDLFSAQTFGEAFQRVRRLVLPTREEAYAKERARNESVLMGNPKALVNRHHFNFLKRWWMLSYPRGELISRLEKTSRYIACARVTLRPIFEFLDAEIRPNDKLQVFVLEDDYSFGVISSSVHWAWFIAKCTTLGATPNYNAESIWDTFPWPQAPTEAQVAAAAGAAVALRTLRHTLRQQHTLTLRDLYRTLDEPGKNPLRDAHEKLNAAVRAAYGMGPKDDPLTFLLDLNQSLARDEAAGKKIVGPGLPPSVADPEPFITTDAVRVTSTAA